MKIAKLIFVCLFCFVALSPLSWSQSQPNPSNQKQGAPTIPGVFDPRTGMFTAHAQSAAPAAVATTNVLARLIFNFNIRNDQQGGGPTHCYVSLQTQGDAAGYYDESAQSTATNGGTSCSVTLLFSWDLATPTTDTIRVTYGVSSNGEDANGNGPYRSTYHEIAPIPVPSNFETINLPPINVTI